jgi:hypothetical protein
MNAEARLTRIENMLSKALHVSVARQPKRMLEKEVCEVFNISAGRLKQLRLGCHKRGKYEAPKIFKWGHVNGRRIDYDVEELNQVFKRTTIGGAQIKVA